MSDRARLWGWQIVDDRQRTWSVVTPAANARAALKRLNAGDRTLKVNGEACEITSLRAFGPLPYDVDWQKWLVHMPTCWAVETRVDPDMYDWKWPIWYLKHIWCERRNTVNTGLHKVTLRAQAFWRRRDACRNPKLMAWANRILHLRKTDNPVAWKRTLLQAHEAGHKMCDLAAALDLSNTRISQAIRSARSTRAKQEWRKRCADRAAKWPRPDPHYGHTEEEWRGRRIVGSSVAQVWTPDMQAREIEEWRV